MFRKGNLITKKNIEFGERGWFIGYFIKDEFFNNDNFEVKFGVHKKNEVKNKSKLDHLTKTLVILIKGKMEISFPTKNKKFLLKKLGDFLAYGASSGHHINKFYNKTICLTIHWPSKR